MSTVVKPPAFQRAPKAPEARSIATAISQFALNLDASLVPAEVVARAKLHMLDAFGIALASTGYDYAHRTLTALRAMGGSGPIPVIGMPDRLPLRDAVHMNGTLIHGLDYDDTHSGGVVHATASVLPTVLGVGIDRGASGMEMLLAYLAGVEVTARLGMAANGGFHRIGFHPTGLLGAFGCTVAAGRLMGLSARRLDHAQGICLSMAAGSLEFLADGAWTKRQHPGWAGVCGVTAASMAKAGFEGPKAPYEGRFGLYNAYLGGVRDKEHDADLSVCAAGLGQQWELMNVAFKPFPACHFNHAFADAALALRREHGLTTDRIAGMTALIHETQVPTVCEPEAAKRRPQNSYEAQFSVHYAMAAAIARGQFTLDELESEVFTDPEILALCDRCGYELDPDSSFPRYYSGAVRVETTDGQTLFHREAKNRGSDGKPLTAEEIAAKYLANAVRATSADRAETLRDVVMRLDETADLDSLDAALTLR